MNLEKINFYSEIMVSKQYPGGIKGKLGVVLGISEENNMLFGYSILLHGDENTIYLDKQYAIPTGRKFTREDFY
ncbi:immunity protein 31 [Uruburuella testudinis]|uniref:Immunity protein 31 n=1 Tax=Uruburuella testudinis TaxID=1282863 RepID=A0ABY4DUV3_9NEIS|nr:Imm31 family immunity protein [Uruburuella testudinis]UOO82817.1 immunity protein 31 [Uruburuella testudinis]